jgi:hypothetical protein
LITGLSILSFNNTCGKPQCTVVNKIQALKMVYLEFYPR